MDVSYNSNQQLPYTDNMKKILNNPNMGLIFLLFGIIIIYIILFSFLGTIGISSNNSQKSNSYLRIFELIIFAIFILAVVMNFKYFSGNDLSFDAIMKNVFKPDKIPEMDIYVGEPNKQDNKHHDDHNKKGEVFHVPNNVYNYEQAKAICKAYDSKLATYDEIEDAYNKGANWCSYGWSEGQLALFPTQKSTYKKLQDMKGHENDCGRPGINGGFINNKLVKFGANCFGPKPLMNENDQIYMDNLKYKPVTKESTYVDKNAEKYKDQLDEIVVAPFNKDKWSLSQPLSSNKPKPKDEDKNVPEPFFSY